jgi:hypothetical protein
MNDTTSSLRASARRMAGALAIGLFAIGAAQAQVCPGVPRTTPDADFFDAGNGTVLHIPTGLVWKRCSEGQAWGGGTCYGYHGLYTWQEAFARVDAVNQGLPGTDNAGQTDWRIPNVNELQSIVERGCAWPSINGTWFPNTHGSLYWASSPMAGISGNAWTVGFYYGGVGGQETRDVRSEPNHIRLVRAGKAPAAFDSRAPRAPALLLVTARNQAVALSFQAAAAGPAATAFTATCTAGDITRMAVGTASPITVGNLVNGQTYTCQVTAGNVEGSSLPSNSAQVAPHTTVPGAPGQLRLVPIDRGMKVFFAAPTDDGGVALSGYVATCTGGGATVHQPGNASPILVTGLTNGVSYSCSVHAQNSLGAGAETAAQSKVARKSTVLAPLLPSILDDKPVVPVFPLMPR